MPPIDRGQTLTLDPLPAFVGQALQERVTILRKELAKVRQVGDEETVHDARVASRRLRSALLLLAEVEGSKKLRRRARQIRDITRTLGTLRDTDVQLLFVAHRLQEAINPQDHRAGLLCLQAWLERKRHRRFRRVRRSLTRLRRQKTLKKLQAAWEDAPAAPTAEEKVLLREQLSPLLLARLGGVMGQLAILEHPEDAAALHSLRIALKQLRYTLEILAPLFATELAAVLAVVKDLQTLLGDIHDADVWTQFLPEFLVKQRRRFRPSEVAIVEQERVLDDLAALLVDRYQHRQRLQAQLLQHWHDLEKAGVWQQLQELLHREGGISRL
jgi:CHAD domain-containing protein